MKIKRIVGLLLSIIMTMSVFCTGNAEAGVNLPEFEIGDYFVMGQYNGEPIVWRYIKCDLKRFDRDYFPSNNNDEMLLYSDRILCFKEFDLSDNIDDITNSWEDSMLRKWLNSTSPSETFYDGEKGFLSKDNFTKEERNVIKKEYVDTFVSKYDIPEELRENAFGNSYTIKQYPVDATGRMYLVRDIGNMKGGLTYTTQDKMFLMDESQIYSIYRYHSSAAAELFESLVDENAIEDYNYAYWIRSPYNDLPWEAEPLEKEVCKISGENADEPQREGYDIMYNVNYKVGDKYSHSPANEPQGVRPAFYLDTENAVIVSGTGTKEDPYVLTGKKVIDIILNGSELVLDQEPVINDGIVLVPLREVFEAMDAEVIWEDETKTVTAIIGEDKITLQIGSSIITKNGAVIDLGYPVTLKDDRTMIPLNAIDASFSISVDWNPDTLTATIVFSE